MTTAARAEGLRYEVVEAGDVDAVKAALAKGADVDAPVVGGEDVPKRPLLIAAIDGRLDLVRLLVERGAAVEREETGYSKSAFEAAFSSGRFDVASFLLDAPPYPSQKYLGHVLYTAITSRLPEEPSDDAGIALARRALARGLRPDAPELRWTFHQAAAAGDLRALELLLATAHVDPDLRAEEFEGRFGKEEYEPPLVDAARNDHIETVRWLLDHGARTDMQGRLGMTALHWAARHGREDIAKLLLERGASPAVLDAEGHRATWEARRQRRPAVLELFAAAGAALTSSEEAEVVALEEAYARRVSEEKAYSEESSRSSGRRKLAIKAGAFAAWALYLGASIAAQRMSAGSAFGRVGAEFNLWAGPLLAGAGTGALAFTGPVMILLAGARGSFPVTINPSPFGKLQLGVGVATMITLATLNAAHRSDLASHRWLYYAGPVLSGAIPVTLSILW